MNLIVRLGRKKLCAGLFGSLVCLTAGSLCADTIYSTGADGTQLYSTNSTNGASVDIGPFGYSAVYADAFSPGGQLYVMINSYSPSQLATVDILTGAATPIGSPTGIDDMMSLEFTPSGTLYAASWATNDLYTMNLSTGAATLVGSLGMPGSVMDLAWDPLNSTMYGLSSSGPDGSLLYSVDLSSGAGTLVTNIPEDSCLMGLDITQAGEFLATDYCTSNTPLYEIDTSNGNLTSLGNTGISGAMGGDELLSSDAGSVPEPITLLTFGTGCLALLRRKTISGKS